MINSKFRLLAILFVTALFSFNTTNAPHDVIHIVDYSECAAILYKGKVLVDKYSPSGKCILSKGMEGKLSLSTITTLTETRVYPVKTLKFHVAIKNKDTNTLFLLTKEAVQEIQWKEVASQCKRGDTVIFLTADKKYSLTHHEIEIDWSC